MIPVIEGHATPPSHQAHGTHHGLAARDTWEGPVLRAAWGYEVERHMRGSTNILVGKGPIGPCVALAHHTLADKVDPAHDEEGEDDANDRPNGTAVGWDVIRRWLVDFTHELVRSISTVGEGVALLLDEDTLAAGAPELIGQTDSVAVCFIRAILAVGLTITA